jgi:transcriptional regulator with PAS, ATPase and Fis domain
MFGHEKGSFTGATDRRIGRFELAHTGTLFLDEVGDLGAEAQAKLLRAIEAKEILPVGSTEPVKVDVRIIAASNRDLKKMASEGTFREDLYYRLAVIEIALPPLRDRREDIPPLVEYLVRRHNREMKRAYRGVDNAAMKVLLAQPWKGNVRELDNAIEHAMIVGEGEWITPQDLPRAVSHELAPEATAGDDLREAMRTYERMHIETVLKRLQGDKRAAADRLGLSLSSLYRKIDELGIRRE